MSDKVLHIGGDTVVHGKVDVDGTLLSSELLADKATINNGGLTVTGRLTVGDFTRLNGNNVNMSAATINLSCGRVNVTCPIYFTAPTNLSANWTKIGDTTLTEAELIALKFLIQQPENE